MDRIIESEAISRKLKNLELYKARIKRDPNKYYPHFNTHDNRYVQLMNRAFRACGFHDHYEVADRLLENVVKKGY